MKNRKLAVLLAGLLAVSTAIPALAGPASELKDQGTGTSASAGQTYQQSSASGAQSQSSTKAKK